MLAIVRTITAFSLVAFVAVTVGCKEEKPCAKDIEESVALKVVKGSNNLLMSVDKLDFLNDPTIIWDDIDLNITLKGKRVATENISLSFNGYKFNRKDGRRHLEAMDFLKNKNNSSSRFKLHKMYLNGAEPFHVFLARIKKNKGVLEVRVFGKKLEILEAVITFKGKSYIKCPEPTPTPGATPTPTPTPVPVAPETSLDSMDPAKSPTSSTTISFTFSSSTDGNSFWCSLDGAAASKCTSPMSYSDLVNGSHSFKVYAQNPQGLADKTPATYSWKVDTAAPSVTITNSASLATLTKARDISFNFTASKPGSTFKCSLDGAASVSCVSPMDYSGLAEGVHLFSVNATDSLGNVGKVPDTFRWTVDATAPSVSFIDVNPGDAVSNITSKAFTFSADESANFACSLDGSAYAACVSPVSLKDLAEGSHLFEVRATDAAGNQGLPISYSWETDKTAPEISLGAVSPAAGLTNASNVSVEFATSEAATVYCSLDGAAVSICQSPFSAKDLAEGSHSLEISAADVAGNMSAPVALAWTMDLTAPVLSFGDIAPASSRINVTNIQLPVNLPEGVVLYASVNGSAAAVAQSPIILSGLAEGNYSVSVYGIDAAGNTSSAISHQFAVDLTAPVISLAAENTASLTNSDRNAFSMTSNEDVAFECNLDNAGFASCASPLEVTGLVDGQHIIQLRATDLAGNVSEIAQYGWSVDTKAPTTSVVGVTNKDQASITITADEDGVSFLCSLDGEPMSACSSPMSYSGLEVGEHSILAKAVDAAGNIDPVGGTYQFVVIKPIKTNITAATPGESPTSQSTMNISFTADQAGATFLCSLDGGAAQVCRSPVVYTGVVDGPHKFVVKAVDAYGNMDPVGASYSWMIDSTPPQVSGLTTSVTTNSITVSWTTSEPATSQVTYGVGSNMNQATAESSALATSHSIKLTGLSSNTTYTIQVRGRDIVGNVYASPTRTVKTNK